MSNIWIVWNLININVNYLLIQPTMDVAGDFQQDKEQREQQERNPSWIGLINNNYIDSENQTRPESGINPLSPNPNSFKDNHKNIIRNMIILEGIRIRWEGIYTGFWPGLVLGINIIIIY